MKRDAMGVTESEFLFSETASKTLGELMVADLGEAQTLALLAKLRSRYAPHEAGALLTQARLRIRARTKFPHADRMFFTAEALEQATAWPVALRRAGQIDRLAKGGAILDLGCGIGGDALALAQFRPVVAYELDPVRADFARANARILGLADRLHVQEGDWTAALRQGNLATATAAFVDPARRVDGRRVFRPQEMQPPLSALMPLRDHVALLVVKIMPGVKDVDLPDDCSVQFVSHQGTCKEAVLWFGPENRSERQASVQTASGWIDLAASGMTPPSGTLAAGQTLHEPDPAVIRAGALAELCSDLGAHLFDPQIAYLVAPGAGDHPLTASFVIHEVHRFSLKQLNRRLQALEIGEVELKKRGFPNQPESLRPRLKLVKGGSKAVIFFTRRGREHLMLIASRAAATPPDPPRSVANEGSPTQ